MRKIIPVVLLLFTFFQSFSLIGQDLLRSNDLSAIKVDNLTEADITKIKIELQFNKLTLEQIEPMVLAKGMSGDEFAKLKARLRTGPSKSSNNGNDTTPGQLRTQESFENFKIKDSLNSLVFGSELFDNPTLNFEPNLKLATPVNYIVGPGDELQISIYGVQEFNANIPVTVEGKVNIQNVGLIQVAGMTIEATTQKIRAAMAKIYTTLRTGQSKIGVNLSRIRTIKITLIGSKQPGNYSISSLATIYNALFLGGGPGNNGSYRNIELIRDNKVFAYVDLYKFLVNGNQADNVGLKDNDVIRIPTYSLRVTIEGDVKRPGIFEMKEGESFADLLNFASGFSDLAYTATINVIQKTSKEFKIKDLKSTEFKNYNPLSGDVFKVSRILDRFENRIKVDGSVFRPGTYSFYEGMRISDLITQADGLKEDAYTQRAIIVRLKPDLTQQVVNVNLASAINNNAEANILLNREDQVTVYSILDFEEQYIVSINGEIKTPGDYPYKENLTLNDLLIQSGGLLGSASKRVEIARMLKSDESSDINQPKAKLFNLDINTANNEQIKNFELQPFDVINIRKMAVYEPLKKVTASGQVVYPGIYILVNKQERVYDIINRAGGLTSEADLNGVKIKRPIQAKHIEAIENVNLNLKEKDSANYNIARRMKEDVKFATIPIEWNKIVANPSDNTNIILLAGDEIEIAIRDESVKVKGNVLLNSEIPYMKGKGLNYYVNAVGGVDAKAWKKKAYIIYPNGKAAVTNSFLFLKFYPKVAPGAQIIIPQKPETNKLSIGEIVSISSVLVGMAGIVIAIINSK